MIESAVIVLVILGAAHVGHATQRPGTWWWRRVDDLDGLQFATRRMLLRRGLVAPSSARIDLDALRRRILAAADRATSEMKGLCVAMESAARELGAAIERAFAEEESDG